MKSTSILAMTGFLSSLVALAATAAPRPERSLSEQAVREFRLQCEKGVAESCHRIAQEVLAAPASVGDEAVAKARHVYLARACAAGLGLACFEAAAKLAFSERGQFLGLGCEKGHAQSCYELGDFHMIEDKASSALVPSRESVRHFLRACELHLTQGCAAAADNALKLGDAAKVQRARELGCQQADAAACSELRATERVIPGV